MTLDLKAQIQELHDHVRQLRRDLAPLPEELGIALLEGETPADGIRRAFAELRSGDGESARLLQAIRKDLGAIRRPKETGVPISEVWDAQQFEVTTLRDALGMAAPRVGATIAEQRQEALNAIADLRRLVADDGSGAKDLDQIARDAHLRGRREAMIEVARRAGVMVQEGDDTATVAIKVRDAIMALRESAAGDEDETDRRQDRADIMAIAGALGVVDPGRCGTGKACLLAVTRLKGYLLRVIDECEPRDGESIEETALRTIRELKAGAHGDRTATVQRVLLDIAGAVGLELQGDHGPASLRMLLIGHYQGLRSGADDKALLARDDLRRVAEALDERPDSEYVAANCIRRAQELRQAAEEERRRGRDDLELVARALGVDDRMNSLSTACESAAVALRRRAKDADAVRVDVLRSLAQSMGLDVPEGADAGALGHAILTAWQERGRAAQATRPATRGAGPRLDAVLGALGLEPAAWRSAKPEELALRANEVLGDVDTLRRAASCLDAVLGELGVGNEQGPRAPEEMIKAVRGRLRDFEARSGEGLDEETACGHGELLAQLCERLECEDEASLVRDLDLLKDWCESACNCLERLWYPLVDDYPLERKANDERTGKRASVLVDVTDVADAIGRVVAGRDYRDFDPVLQGTEDLRDVLGALADDWGDKRDRVNELEDEIEQRTVPKHDANVHEGAARAIYEHVHGAGSWLTADALLKHDWTRAVREQMSVE